MKTKFMSLKDRTSYRGLEDVVGCKWSAAVVAALGAGIHRPGQLERSLPGLSAKILNERLRKLCAYALVTRTEFEGLPLHVEYHLTAMGKRLARVIRQLGELQKEHARRRSP